MGATLFAIGVVGCTSLQTNDYHQTIAVTSSPPGAKVTVDGEYKGQTPFFLRLRRGRASEFHFTYADGLGHSSATDQFYRWTPSFWGNLFFLTLAPVGWGTDYLTGTAFRFADVHDNKTQGISAPASESFNHAQWVIAPPVTENSALSANVGVQVQAQIRREFPSVQLVPYTQTEVEFWNVHWRHDNQPDVSRQNEVLKTLKAAYYVQATARGESDPMIIRWKLIDSYTKNVVLERELFLPRNDVASTRQRSWVERQSERFNFLPDLFSIEVGPTFTQLAVNGGRSERSREIASPLFLGSALKYLSALNIGVATPQNTRGGFKWDLTFVPSFQAISLREQFPDDTTVSNLTFERMRFNAGYGARAGVNSIFGYLYVTVVPMLGWTQLRVIRDNRRSLASRTSVNTLIEIGYSRFLSDNINIRLFFKAVSEDTEIWRRGISQSLGTNVNVNSVSYETVGLSVGYYFPEIKSWIRY